MAESTTTWSHPGPAYTMHESERRVVVNPFLAARRRSWWDGVSRDALVDDALVYVELEDKATKVRTFKIDLVDGLMQTPEYAAAVIRASVPGVTEERIRRQVAARTRRQSRLRGPNPIHIEAIITECALRIQVGGRATMRGQLEHLLRLAGQPNVDLRVVPKTGAYPAMGTPFYLLTFESGYPDVGYIELLDKGVYLEEPADIELYAVKFASLRAVARSREASRELIAALVSGQD